ncbi:translation initiation factor 2 [Pseudomonas sp.]|uniref:translation initiation factor 2 n=1 Tax=Pseudomonas sp. TaxID=306 RepID=UPI0028ABADE1|nr:translation initiation factor 2 [Pseudomonas sp.]
MRPLTALLFAAALVTLPVHAEQPDQAAAQLDALEQRLAVSEAQRNELAGQLQQATRPDAERQLQRLREENRRLLQDLEKARSEKPQPLLSEQQLWFVIGGGVALVAFFFGSLLRGNRSARRQWTN